MFDFGAPKLFGSVGRRLITSVPQAQIGKLPHLIEPRTLIGASALTASYFFYLWYTDDGKGPSDYPKGFEVCYFLTRIYLFLYFPSNLVFLPFAGHHL